MPTATFQLTQQDYLAFVRLHLISSMPRIALYFAFCVAAFFIFGWIIDDFEPLPAVLAGAAMTLIAMVLLAYFVFLPRHTAKTWREYALIREQMDFASNADGFTLTQPSAHVTVAWSHIVKWEENQAVFAIFATRQLAYIIPKQAVEADFVDFVRDRLIDSGLNRKGKTRT